MTKFSSLACFAALALVSVSALAQQGAMFIEADRVWTGEGATHTGWGVLVQQGRIAAVGPAAGIAVPDGAERIRLPGKTLIPGLIDLHSHVLLHPYNEASWDDQVLKEPVE